MHKYGMRVRSGEAGGCVGAVERHGRQIKALQ